MHMNKELISQRDCSTTILQVLFFLSGASSLIFETIFTRLLTYTFGNTAYAVSTVLASFLGGLAVGAFVLGGWLDRRAIPTLLRRARTADRRLLPFYPQPVWVADGILCRALLPTPAGNCRVDHASSWALFYSYSGPELPNGRNIAGNSALPGGAPLRFPI